jgi:hypothetical protein
VVDQRLLASGFRRGRRFRRRNGCRGHGKQDRCKGRFHAKVEWVACIETADLKRWFAWLLGLLLAGCSESSTNPPPPLEPDLSQADLYIYFRTPVSWNQETRFQINVTSPTGEVQRGSIAHDWPEDASCSVDPIYNLKPLCPRGGFTRAEGDFHDADPSTTGPYPYAKFSDVRYNDTWTIEVERLYFQMMFSEVTGEQPQGAESCAYFGFGAPGKDLRVFDGAAVRESPKCYLSGTVYFDYRTGAWSNSTGTVFG